MNPPLHRTRFLSEWHQCTPKPTNTRLKLNKFFPESPKISNLKLCEDLEDLFLDEPLNLQERAEAIEEINSKRGASLSQNNFCRIKEENSIDSFELQIEARKKKTENDFEDLEVEEDDYLKEYDELSIMGIMDDSLENETQVEGNEASKSKKYQKNWIGKRNFGMFLEGGFQNQKKIGKIPEGDDYEKLIQKEVDHSKNLLDKFLNFKQNSFETECNKLRRRCKSFHGFGDRQIFQFMNKNKK